MTQKKILSAFAVALFSTVFVGGIFYLTDNRFKTTEDDKMFSWGFVVIYFSGMFIVNLFSERLMKLFKKN